MLKQRNKCQSVQGLIDNCGPIHGGSDATPILGASSTISQVVNTHGNSEIINHIVVRPTPSQPKTFVESSCKSRFPPIPVSDSDNSTSQHPKHGDVRQCKIECAVQNVELNHQEVAIEGGTINISSAYSQGLVTSMFIQFWYLLLIG